uniref:Uncharacterized protein n=1 Tax=Globodera rostochiensis TaxID=31243 RepID=A0A914I5G0_GLORO
MNCTEIRREAAAIDGVDPISQHAAAHITTTNLTVLFFDYVVTPCATCIVTKFAWIKAHNRSWNTEGAAAASASDKESGRITLICLAIQIVAVCQLAYISASNLQWFNDFMLCDPIGKMLFFPVQLAINLYYVADELFLLLLCKEMRKNCAQMITKAWPFTTAQVAATDNGHRTSVRHDTIFR